MGVSPMPVLVSESFAAVLDKFPLVNSHWYMHKMCKSDVQLTGCSIAAPLLHTVLLLLEQYHYTILMLQKES
jgi:hypothetical protein